MSMSLQPIGMGNSSPVTTPEQVGGNDQNKQLLEKLKGDIERIFQLVSKVIGQLQGGAGAGGDAAGDANGGRAGGTDSAGGGDHSGSGCSGADGGGQSSGGGNTPSARDAGSGAPGAKGGSADAAGEPAPPNSGGSGSKALIDEINRVRVANGLNPVTEAANLNRAAAQNDAAQQTQGIGHHVPLGNNGASGEIAFMASNGATPQNSVQGWLDSPGHREILLDPNMTKVGADMSGQFSTADFS